jgi:hypothetical protein
MAGLSITGLFNLYDKVSSLSGVSNNYQSHLHTFVSRAFDLNANPVT